MSPNISITGIKLDNLKEVLSRYHIRSKLADLDRMRYNTIPDAMRRRKGEKTTILQKSEVASLVEWKLKHGTYRPKLAQLVAANDTRDLHATIEDAFSVYDSNPSDPAAAVATLAKLKGIGPATASLLLSCYDPDTVPFFSDELYRYVHWEDSDTGGWTRKIGYTFKEYRSLCEKVKELRKRTGIRAIDLEKMAYVLGQEKADLKPSAHEERVSPKSLINQRPAKDATEVGNLSATAKENGSKAARTETSSILLRRSKRKCAVTQEHAVATTQSHKKRKE